MTLQFADSDRRSETKEKIFIHPSSVQRANVTLNKIENE
jgi:hypothetical protein